MPPDSVVAVDVGGTAIKAARIADDGSIEDTITVPTPAGETAIVERVTAVIAELRTSRTVAVGLSTPGLVDDDTGIVAYAANLGFDRTPLAYMVEAKSGLRTVLKHDVRAACLAELRVADSVEQDMILVVLGTGLAAGFVVAGSVVTGASNIAGEFGHIPAVPNGEHCGCGQYGCLEAYASAGGLLRRYHRDGGTEDTVEKMVAVLETDPLSARIWSEGMQILGRALVTATVMFDPAVIVLGGGMSGAGHHLLDPVREHLADGLAWRSPPPVRLTRLGASAGMLGAAVHAFASISGTFDTSTWRRG